MTDRGEREVRKWALRRDGDELKPHDVVELVFALDDDHADDMKEIKDLIGELAGRVTLHHEWADTELKPAVKELQTTVEDLKMEGPRHDAMHDDHMREHHANPRRFDDPEEVDFSEVRKSDVLPVLTSQQTGLLQLLAGWSLAKKLAYAALAALVVGLVGMGLSYAGSSIAANRAEEKAIHAEQTLLPTPTVTVTVEATP